MVRIEQIYTPCLAHAAYYVESNGVAAIIDPLRDPKPYIALAKKHGAKIHYVIETHFHADFVTGQLDLQALTGAEILYGPTASPSFKARILADGEIISLGGAQLKTLHTPGHTMESTSFLLQDANGQNPQALFSGDTLFLGDVGRPDLAQKAASMTQEQLAALLFRSLREKIMVLPGHITVYPGHGAGSACGKNLSSDRSSTLQKQFDTNYALRKDMTEAEFVKEVTDGLQPPPGYFPESVAQNKGGAKKSYASIIEKARANHLSPQEVRDVLVADRSVLVVDTREGSEYVQGSIPGSIFAGIDGKFGPYFAEAFPEVKRRVIYVTGESKRGAEIVDRLTRVGYNNVIGHLEGGMKAWKAAGLPVQVSQRISPKDFAALITQHQAAKGEDALYIIDARKPGEIVANGGLPQAVNLPLGLPSFKKVDKDRDVYVYCAGAYRSLIYATALKELGHRARIVDIAGGFGAMEADPAMRRHLVLGGECPRMRAARLLKETKAKL